MRYDPTQSPRLVAWEATRACRLACVHCRAVAQPHPDPRQLTTDDAFRLVDQIATFSPPVILIITGGDPLMREDIFEVAARASARGVRVVMSPSGTQVTPAIIARLQAAGVQRISVSLDGSTPELHDRFRQVPGAFAEATQGLAYAREAGLPFQINTTVTRHNLQDLPAMLRKAIELGAVTWDVFMLVPTGRGKVAMEITPEEYEATLHFVYEASLAAPIQLKMTCAPHYKRVQLEYRKAEGRRPSTPSAASGVTPPGAGVVPRGGGGAPAAHGFSRGCMAGFGFCFVSHTGEVGGCGYLPLLAGNVREAPLPEIYRESPLFESLRDSDLLKGRCGACEYRALCGGCRARALGATGDYLDEEPFCTYQPRGKGRKSAGAVGDAAPAIPIAFHEAREEAIPRYTIPPAF